MGHCARAVERSPHIVGPTVVLGRGYKSVWWGLELVRTGENLPRENTKESVRQ